MATTDAERLIESWVRVWSSHDPEEVVALFTDDCVYEDVTFGVVLHGRDELRSFAAGAFAAVPDIAFELKSRFVAGSSAGLEWVMRGTHRGDFPGLPATGKRFSSIRGATILQLHDGRIRRNSDYWDAATFMRQVGLLPSPPAAGSASASG
jgi:steroid delta-isomerase-like uncharacterized protein